MAHRLGIKASGRPAVSARIGDGTVGGGADLRFVQGFLEFMGHSKLKATEVYTHVALTQLKAVYEACTGAGARVPAAAPDSSATGEPTKEEVLAALEEKWRKRTSCRNEGRG
jgi:hypothetical protein